MKIIKFVIIYVNVRDHVEHLKLQQRNLSNADRSWQGHLEVVVSGPFLEGTNGRTSKLNMQSLCHLMKQIFLISKMQEIEEEVPMCPVCMDVLGH